MQAISLWLAAAIVILTGWAIVKKYQVNMVLFIAGLLLNIIGVMKVMDLRFFMRKILQNK